MTHVSLDDLADLHVGEASTEVAAHVAGCADCTARLSELESALGPVAAALAALPDPEVPADVVARLDALTPPTIATGTVVPLQAAPSRRTTSWLPALGAVAAAAVLVTGGVLVVQNRDGSSSKDAATSTFAGKAPGLPTSSSGNDYAKDGKALAAALPGLLGGGVAGEAAPQAPTDASAPARTTVATSADGLGRLRTQDGLAACLAGLSDPTSTDLPLALDYASFEGQPALVVVLPTAKAGKVDVYVVSAACDQADQHLLFYTRLAKP